MTGSDRHNNDNQHNETGKILEHFPSGERDHIRHIWEKSRSAKPHYAEVSRDEVEYALGNLHKRMDAERSVATKNRRPAIIIDWRWMAAAAAAVLLILAAGILWVPKEVNVPYAETRIIDLPDGSSVTLNSGSTLWYGRLFSYLNRNIELNGEAYFSVQEGELPFTVQANGTTVRVTGTEFNVRSWKGDPGSETEVTVSEGTVVFYPGSRKNRSVILKAGQFSRWSQDLEEPAKPDSISLSRALGWRSQVFAFNKKPMAVILQELERRFDVQIELEAPAYQNEAVTVYYVDPQNVEVILKDICRIKGLRYSQTADGYRIYR